MINRTLLFGEGLFETWRVYPGRKLPLIEEHLERMSYGCLFFGWPFKKNEAKSILSQTLPAISANIHARLLLTLIVHGQEKSENTTFLTQWQPLPPTISSLQRQGVKLMLAPWAKCSNSPLLQFKTTCFLENNLALKQARQNGYYEALFLNEKGEITEGCISNIFFVKDQAIVTPSLDSGLLPGITRGKIINILFQKGIRVKERPVFLKELFYFKAAFLTNAIIEVMPIIQIGDIKYPIWQQCAWLRKLYRDAIGI